MLPIVSTLWTQLTKQKSNNIVTPQKSFHKNNVGYFPLKKCANWQFFICQGFLL